VSPSSITLLASSQINQDQLRSNSSSPDTMPTMVLHRLARRTDDDR
jgi:hypothetical protein